MRIFGISGSLQPGSTNHAVLDVVREGAPADVELVVFDELAAIPPFDASIGEFNAPAPVKALRESVASCEGVLIASPEYAHSLPGVLKNALDWLVGSGELANKPVAIVTASTTPMAGLRAQAALIHTLLAQSAEIVALLPIGNSRLKTNEHGAFVHEPTRRRIRETFDALVERCREV